jgi:hypothetical protein
MPPPGVVAARERLAFVAQVLVGYNVEVTLKSGDVYEGVFHSASVSDAQWKKDDLVFTVRMAELKATKAGRAQRSKPADVMKIAVADLVSLKASDVGMTDLAVGPSRSNADGFTDGGISKNERFERTLVAWTWPKLSQACVCSRLAVFFFRRCLNPPIPWIRGRPPTRKPSRTRSSTCTI